MAKGIRVTVWGENVHERRNPIVRQIYPGGMHNCIAAALREDRRLEVRTATLEQPQHGLTKSVLAGSDVLVSWGHAAHGKVRETVVDRVLKRIWQGMGFVALHSSHCSKIFKRLMGTSGSLTWREAGERERLWVCNPGHPIAHGIDKCFEIENTEMYGEPFAIPMPDDVVFISWFDGGEVFRSGCTWKRGNGKIFYSISVPGTRFTRSIIIRSLGWSCATRCTGRRRKASRGWTGVRGSHFSRRARRSCA
ncbi:MAG TPA: ThuA domain-containing protein [Chthoniobacterales bacterium]